MTDHEQIRRDAQQGINDSLVATDLRCVLAHDCLALLSELEQAKRERDEYKAWWGADDWRGMKDRAEQAERERDAYKETLDNTVEDASARVEQAERERDDWKLESERGKWPKEAAQEFHQMKARLAKVPALVEVGSRLRAKPLTRIADQEAWDAALAAWEQK